MHMACVMSTACHAIVAAVNRRGTAAVDHDSQQGRQQHQHHHRATQHPCHLCLLRHRPRLRTTTLHNFRHQLSLINQQYVYCLLGNPAMQCCTSGTRIGCNKRMTNACVTCRVHQQPAVLREAWHAPRRRLRLHHRCAAGRVFVKRHLGISPAALHKQV
jgi:hypothetical protein